MSEAANPRVAVDVLVENQRDVLFRGAPDREPALTPLVESFANRRDLINWWQAASVRTFGYLSTFFPARKLIRDGKLGDTLVGDDDAADAHQREVLVEKLLSATRQSYRDLEVRATEWLGEERGQDDYRRIDPGEQQYVAMRPAFSRLDADQATALAELWAGFNGRQELAEWVHSLPSIADFDGVLDEPLSDALLHSEYARTMLIEDAADADAYRERFAALVLLPAFGKRARTLRAGERVATAGDDNPWNEVRDS